MLVQSPNPEKLYRGAETFALREIQRRVHLNLRHIHHLTHYHVYGVNYLSKHRAHIE